MRINKKLTIFLGIAAVIISCNKAEDLGLDHILTFQKPVHFPEPIYKFGTSAISRESFELGKRLFYDPILSRDNTISCGSCHIAQHSFTHHGHDVSHGIDDQLGIRNAMPLINLAWSPNFFWDGGVHDLDLSPMVPIENPIEMDEKVTNVISKLQRDNSYKKQFKKVYGSETIGSSNLFKALSHFMAMLVSANSKYDQIQQGKAQFTSSEQKGYTLYQQNCSTCHQEPFFTDYSFRDNGIGVNPSKDQGRYEITQVNEDRLKFKVPSLRNLKYTSPYMHDGRFLSVQAVINHYRYEVQSTDNLDPILRKNMGIKLSDEDVTHLLAFLETLNDEEFINNKLFAE